MRRRDRGRRRDYRAIDPTRARRISASAAPLALGSFSLATALTGSAVYLAVGWATKVPLLAMTVGAHGAQALIAALFGIVTMSMRNTVSARRLELRSANAVRRNLLVLWNLGLLMACLGWLALGVGVTAAPEPIGAPTAFVEILVPAVLVVYNGVVVVLAHRLLRA
ncbi:hypothetical protein [Saccharomonospora xinjiangensis]|uniref:hypothetical protein n=1 Tax=Saccharomonospora xinjiangensis TaxID=75294 RepID=UPI001E39DFD5|nr:hypothetical protein [Saccharomonospora xinjiangensis]